MKKIIILMFSFFTFLSFSEQIRKISVTGFAEKEIMPDIANILFSSYTKDVNLEKASVENQKNIENFKNDLKKSNIKYSNLETTNFYSRQTSERDTDVPDQTKVEENYKSNLTFYVELQDSSKITSLLDFARKNNINNFAETSLNNKSYAITLSSEDKNKSVSLDSVFKNFDNLKGQLSQIGVSSNDIIIGSYSVSSSTKNNSTYKTKNVNNVYNNFTLKLDDIKKINEVIKLAEKNKISLTGNITFDISNRENIESELYNEAYEKSKEKAKNILAFSEMKLQDPLVVSESIQYQQTAISDVKSYSTAMEKKAVNAGMDSDMIMMESTAIAMPSAPRQQAQIDYTPQSIKIMKDVSILFEIK